MHVNTVVQASRSDNVSGTESIMDFDRILINSTSGQNIRIVHYNANEEEKHVGLNLDINIKENKFLHTFFP